MPPTPAAVSNSINPNLLAFRPRQVLLLRPEMKETINSKPDRKTLLHRSIAQYLERNDLSKSLKRFLSEAEIEEDDLGSCLDLEEIFFKYIEEVESNKKMEKDDLKRDSSITLKEKKNSKKATAIAIAQAERVNEEAASEGELAGNDLPDQSLKKEKKKKKNKHNIDSQTDDIQQNGLEAKQVTGETIIEETTIVNGISEGKGGKSKGRKKKSKGVESKKDDNIITSGEDAVDTISKKRKRVDSEENNSQPADTMESEELKRRKKEVAKEPKEIPETPKIESNELENGKVEKSEAKSPMQKSMKQKKSNSKEPKKPFQRVNVDDVVFEDERLQDNSYWAKDGAELGYGAKAQEVLGQVRGKGFRHEKTKKKRGSYRGGIIDQNSYSVKFNYSDDE